MKTIYHKDNVSLKNGIVTLVMLAFVLLASCRQIEVEKLYAVQLEVTPGPGDWKVAIPLGLKAGGGHVNGKNVLLEELERDTDPIHANSASCHHGPPITDLVYIDIRAYYTERDLYIELQWEDPTFDTVPRAWDKLGGEWLLSDTDEDGIAILWSRTGGPFGCQEACHMSDFTVRDGELIDLRGMSMATEGDWEEVWVWKSTHRARALILGNQGFIIAGDEVPYRTLNSAVARDTSLRPEARRAGTFGTDDRPVADAEGKPLAATARSAPAYLYGDERGEGNLKARGERWRKGWKVVFSRPLDAGESRQGFSPGERYRFGLAVFDGTSTDHHLVRDTQILELVTPPLPASAPKDREPDRDETFSEDQGIL